MDALLIFLVTLSVLLVLLLAGLIYHAVGSARDRAKYPAPGRMIDVGGYRLHIHCMGEGTPAVVFDSALGGSCLSWTLVQSRVAKFTHACSYDRAGFGWSEAGQMPRTTQQIVEELRALLKNADIPAPYVLVGHSYGGFTARLFAACYPSELRQAHFGPPERTLDSGGSARTGRRGHSGSGGDGAARESAVGRLNAKTQRRKGARQVRVTICAQRNQLNEAHAEKSGHI